MRIDFDFVDLEAFLAVKETGSFHLASERLGLSQSSVSRRIRKLEAALDSTLFQRTTRDVKPTLAAKQLQQRAEAILNDTREATRAMRDESAAFAHQRARSITIATIPTVVPGLLAPAIHAFHSSYPETRFRVSDMSANEVAEAVAQGEAEFGICSVPALEPTTSFELLFNDTMVLALPLRHHLAANDTVRWSDLSGEKLILPQRGTGNRMLIDDALAHTGLPLVWSIEVGRSTTALDLVSAGVGVAPLPRSAMSAAQGAGLACRQIETPPVSRPIGLLMRRGHMVSDIAARFLDVLRQRGAGSHPSER